MTQSRWDIKRCLFSISILHTVVGYQLAKSNFKKEELLIMMDDDIYQLAMRLEPFHNANIYFALKMGIAGLRDEEIIYIRKKLLKFKS